MIKSLEIIRIPKLTIGTKGRKYVNLRLDSPEKFNFSNECRKKIEEWDKKYMEVIVDGDKKIIEFKFNDNEGYLVDSINSKEGLIQKLVLLFNNKSRKFNLEIDEINKRFIHRF
jgi:hypothetical protein